MQKLFFFKFVHSLHTGQCKGIGGYYNALMSFFFFFFFFFRTGTGEIAILTGSAVITHDVDIGWEYQSNRYTNNYYNVCPSMF